MTQLGLDYLRHQEQRRSNLANEMETNRANVAKETENLRHNTATEQQAINELAETNRHNVRTETLEDIKNQATKEHYERQDAATKEHYERQDANQLEVANIKAAADIRREEMSNTSRERINENDNQTKRMTELTKLLPKAAQTAVAYAYAQEDPVFLKHLTDFQNTTGKAKEKAKKAVLKAASDAVAAKVKKDNFIQNLFPAAHNTVPIGKH